MAIQMNNIEKKLEDYTLKLKLNSDKTKAYLEIAKNLKSGSKNDEEKKEPSFPTKAEITDFLNESNIVYGLEDDIVESIYSRKTTKATLVATGRAPVKGEDSTIILKHDTSKKMKLVEDENGNIDFKSLNWFTQVSKGDLLATKTLPKKGIDGKDVCGEPILAEEGKDIPFKTGKNVEESEDGLSLIASIDGMLETVDSKLSVNQVLMIKGDVDASVGNIDFIGDVFVSGDIKTGFKVSSGGSLHVSGVIEAAEITVEKDLVVNGGIQGNEMNEIIVRGSIICKFIENANIFSAGDIDSDFIIHSKVRSGGKITLNGKKSILVGGEVVAKDSIVVSVVGSSMGTKTSVCLGIDVEKEEAIEAKKYKIEEITESIHKLKPVIDIGKEMMQRGKMDTIRKISFTKSVKEYNSLLEELKEAKDDLYNSEQDYGKHKFSFLTVKDKIYPGVKITIIKNSRYIKDFTDSCKIYLKGNEIAIEQS